MSTKFKENTESEFCFQIIVLMRFGLNILKSIEGIPPKKY